MAMVIQHNAAAQLALGELNKNITRLGRLLGKVSSGQKIVGAGDDASAYSISENMRVRIRALTQADQNVKNGSDLLKTAEAGIQQQIELVKTIREKVIDANNDTNTDEDRKIMQKEITQLYDQVEQTAFYTDYNTQKVLIGDTYWRSIAKWVKAPNVMLDPNSIMNIIPDVYDRLDGIDGPFDIFEPVGISETTIEPFYGDETELDFDGGTAGDPSKITYDFGNSYDSATLPGDLDGKGFSVKGVTAGGVSNTVNYVLTTDPGKLYNGKNYVTIDIRGLTSLGDIADKVAAVIGDTQGSSFEVSAADGILTLQSKNDRTQENKNIKISSWNAPATSVTPSGRQGATETGLPVPKYLSGGKNDVYETKILTESRYVFNKSNDRLEYVPGKSESFLKEKGQAASLSVGISDVPAGSGVVVSGTGTAYVKFVDGDTITRGSGGVWLVGKNASGSASSSVVGMTLSVNEGTMTLTALSKGEYGNRYHISEDGFAEVPPGETINYAAVSALSTEKDEGSGGDWAFTAGTDGETAYVDTLDLTDYDTNDTTKLNEFINALKGKDISATGFHISFIDTTVPYSMEAMPKSGYNIDLKELRQAVRGGANILTTFERLMKEKISSRCSIVGNGGKVLRIFASRPGVIGNEEKLSLTESHLAHYDVNFKSWFAKNSDLLQPSVSDYLDGKAIRVYCATCPEQWYNIEFYKPESNEDKPESTSKADFTPIPIDVSNVTDYKSLVQAIYDQGAPQFQLINHFTYIAANPDDGIVTFFDNRAFDPSKEPERWHYPYLQEKGAKIADGLMSDVIKIKKDLLEKRFVIHDTDKASMNIRIHIPDMRLDSIFGIMPDYEKSNIREYSLVSKEDRSALLGRPPKYKGLLDEGLEYLTNAAVIVGAQNARLSHTEANLTVQIENTMASESAIRDADMAKEMTEYTKNNILTQSAQAMLAQANQNSSSVLGLLQ